MSINDTGITVTMKDGQAIDLGDFLQSAMNEIADEFDQLKRRLSALEANLKWLYEESGLDYPTLPEKDNGQPSTPPDTRASG